MSRSKNKRKNVTRELSSWLTAIGQALGLVPLRRRVLVIGGLFVSSIFELIGLTMIIPLWASVSGARESKVGLVAAIRSAMESVGLPFDPVILLAAIVVGLTLKALITVSVTRYVSDIVGDITSDFQLRLVRSLLQAQWSFFIRMPLGRLAHATGPEAGAVGECFLHVANILAACLQALLFLAIASFISWHLAAAVVGIGFLMFLSFGKLVRHSRQAARRHRGQMRQLASNFTDAMIGIKPLRAMGRTDRFTRLFEADTRALAATLRTRLVSGEYVSELQEPVIGCLLAAGLYLATQSLALQPHDVLIMALLLVRTISVLAPMQRSFQKFIQAHDQYQSLLELLNDTSAAMETSGGTREPTFQRSVELEAVSFSHGEKPVLKDLDLEIPRGRITTLAGPSGVGKSTIVDLIVGLYQPVAGRIRVDDTDLREIDLKKWRALIGYVPQEVTLFHDTVLKNVSLWEEGVSKADVVAALQAAGAWSFVEEMPGSLDHVVGERGHRLSGGQRQRISIARALLHKPQLLILDEATTGLDPKTEAEICESVRKLCQKHGLTVLAVSHQPAWQGIADRVYWIRDGKTAERVTRRALPAESAVG